MQQNFQSLSNRPKHIPFLVKNWRNSPRLVFFSTLCNFGSHNERTSNSMHRNSKTTIYYATVQFGICYRVFACYFSYEHAASESGFLDAFLRFTSSITETKHIHYLRKKIFICNMVVNSPIPTHVPLFKSDGMKALAKSDANRILLNIIVKYTPRIMRAVCPLPRFLLVWRWHRGE